MKSFNKLFLTITGVMLFLFTIINIVLINKENKQDKHYVVEINRVTKDIESLGMDNINLKEYQYILEVKRIDTSKLDYFEEHNSDYIIRTINGNLYLIIYEIKEVNQLSLSFINLVMFLFCIIIMFILLYIRKMIVLPLEDISKIPDDLSKGILAKHQNKNKYLGNLSYSMNLLRENIEEKNKRELELLKEKNTLLLSISHDIKTPLSLIKLYTQSLKKDVYKTQDKKMEVLTNIENNVESIANYVSQIISNSNESFFNFEVVNGDFYLSDLINEVVTFYQEKIDLLHIELKVNEYDNCLLYGDYFRAIEILQNIMENAIKYGDKKQIEIAFKEEGNCKVISIINSGNTLIESERMHIFNSFWRGSNSKKEQGSGLGLFICRELINKMNGDIYLENYDNKISFSVMFRKF